MQPNPPREGVAACTCGTDPLGNHDPNCPAGRVAAILWRSPVEMDADEFYGEYVVIPKTDDPDGDEIVLFGATLEEAREIVHAVNHFRKDSRGE